MRAEADFGTAGVALWRLGSEDSRIWTFYARDLSADSLALHGPDLAALAQTAAASTIDFEGEGEILDLVATPQEGHIELEYDTAEGLIQEEQYDKLPSSYVIRKYGVAKGKIVLTFDDGPSREYTPAILDILETEHVPATFFIVGVMAESNLDILKRIYDDGFELGNHTFSHPNLAEVNKERVALELNATRRLIESASGHSTVLFRPPYNADSEPETMQELVPVVEAKAEEFYTVGESIDPLDWSEGVTADSIVARVIAQKESGSIILLHDAGGDREQTVEALPRIIKYFKANGYTFTDVAGLLGKTRDDVMPPLTNASDRTYSRINWAIAQSIFIAEEILVALFVVAILLALARTLFVFVLAVAQWRKAQQEKSITLSAQTPTVMVSVIIPAHNEELHATDTIANILSCQYPQKEIVFVDDGSADGTLRLVKERYGDDSRVQVFTKPNGGKASALDFGIVHARGEIVVCIDADTRLRPDALSVLLDQFSDAAVAAVAGNVKVGNEGNILTRWQSIEYITSQNFDRRAFDLLNCITVVPGAIGAFRKSVLERIGGFTTDTLAEDCDLTIRLLKEHCRVRYNDRAVAYTEAPSTIRMFLRQRFRWTFGIMQNIWKHRDALFDREFGTLGWVALPNMLVFQILLPLLSPLADAVMILSVLTGEWERVLVYYVLFVGVDLLSSIGAFLFERERLSRLWLLLPQRFVYRQLMYWVLIKSAIAALRGTLVGWGLLKRTGIAGVPAT
jgi:cellulose synthase/poly-beta-1,6-N-acetylglucosamine synthase-like glycosyltransferase/peptidoglycan/xylan/chitin deacetylase (PgdA/CDA1 family)